MHALEKEMAIQFSILAWRIPGTGESGGLPSMYVGVYILKNKANQVLKKPFFGGLV